MQKVRIQEEKHVELLKAGKQAKHRLEELAPEIRLKGRGNYFHWFQLVVFRWLVCLLETFIHTLRHELNDAW